MENRKKRVRAQAMEKLKSYRWPGNVRELKNTVERLAIMVPSKVVTLSDLPASIIKPPPDSSTDEGNSLNWQEAREKFERQFILEKLVENKGNISRTAAAIGMERTHLHRKLKAYDIKVK